MGLAIEALTTLVSLLFGYQIVEQGTINFMNYLAKQRYIAHKRFYCFLSKPKSSDLGKNRTSYFPCFGQGCF